MSIKNLFQLLFSIIVKKSVMSHQWRWNDGKGGKVQTHHSIWTALKCSWVGFMTHTSMHGVKYICEDGRRAIERAFFITVVSVMIVAASFMVFSIYKRYSATSTMTNIERTHYPSWRLPFPGVTICNTNRILKSKAEALVDRLVLPKGVSKSEVLEDLKLLTDLREPEFPADKNIDRLQQILEDNRFHVSEVMLQLGQNCKEMLEKCSWRSEIVNCTELFEVRKSHLGFCCSFNYLGMRDTPNRLRGKVLWKVEGEAVHTRLFGQRMGLSLLINPMTYEYFATSFIAAGLTLAIHDSEDFPDETGTAVEKMIPLEKEVMVPIMTSALVSTDNVKDIPVGDRKCVFSDERSLEFFSFYNTNNCITECKMKYYIDLCGCIPYYYPHNGVYRVCDLNDVQCMYTHFETFHTWLNGELPEDVNLPEQVMLCDCPSQCNYVTYEAQLSLGDFKAARHSVNPFFLTETNTTDRVLLHVYLESNFARLYQRDIINTWVDLLSSLGGVTSLFLGCSFVTIIEIIYFFTIRLRTSKIPARRHTADCPFTADSIKRTQVQQAKGQSFSTEKH